MSRWAFVVSKANLPMLHTWLDRAAAVGMRVTFQEQKRSGAQNAAMWSLLTQIARQRPVHNGVKMTPDLYKSVFMQALGCEAVMMPTLEGDGFFSIGHRSSDLAKQEMSDLIELMLAWSAREGLNIEHFGPDGAANDSDSQERAA